MMKVLSGLPALDAPERHKGIGAGTTPTRSPVFPLAELEEARVLAMNLAQPNAAVAASMGKAKVAGKIVQRHEHGQPGAFADLNDEEPQQAILESTRELAEIDPDFAKQLAQQKRASKH